MPLFSKSKGLSLENVQSWGNSFENLLQDKKGVMYFKGFLKAEHSEENMEFWEACQHFKETKANKLVSKAKEICDKFVREDAPNMINLDSGTRQDTLTKSSNPDVRTFDLAQRKIQAMLENDSYPRFLGSAVYKNLLTSATK